MIIFFPISSIPARGRMYSKKKLRKVQVRGAIGISCLGVLAATAFAAPASAAVNKTTAATTTSSAAKVKPRFTIPDQSKLPASVLAALGPVGAVLDNALNLATGELNIKVGGSPGLSEFRPPTQPSGACQSQEAPNGLLYVEELLAGKVGVYNPSTGSYSELTVGPTGAGVGVPRLIDGNIWVPDALVGNDGTTTAINKIDIATGKVTQWSLGLPAGSFSDDVAPGTNGMLYIDSTVPNLITEFDPNTGKVVANFPVPGVSPLGPGGPFTIRPGAGNLLWSPELLGNDISSFDTSTDKFTLYPVPTPAAVPDVAIPGPGGNIWFSEITGDKIGYLDPNTGKMTEFPLPVGSLTAFDIEWNQQTGPNSSMIVADIAANKIYVFNTTTQTWTHEYNIPTLASAPCATGFVNGNAYVGELAGGNVAVVPDH